ncbi:hypothetical protein ACLOJK_037204 [Asimina triloba]
MEVTRVTFLEAIIKGGRERKTRPPMWFIWALTNAHELRYGDRSLQSVAEPSFKQINELLEADNGVGVREANYIFPYSSRVVRAWGLVWKESLEKEYQVEHAQQAVVDVAVVEGKVLVGELSSFSQEHGTLLGSLDFQHPSLRQVGSINCGVIRRVLGRKRTPFFVLGEDRSFFFDFRNGSGTCDLSRSHREGWKRKEDKASYD